MTCISQNAVINKRATHKLATKGSGEELRAISSIKFTYIHTIYVLEQADNISGKLSVQKPAKQTGSS